MDEQTRAVILEAVASGFAALEKQLDERLEEIAIDVEEALQRLDRIEIEVQDVRARLATLSREDVRYRRKLDRLSERLDVLEKKPG